MSLQIILGQAKTGKTRRIYENMKDDISNNKNVILMVPSFMKVKAEEEYMSFINSSGLIGVNITTISDFIENNLKKYNYNIDSKYLSELDKKLILSDLIKNNKDIIKVFNNAKNKEGFINSLVIYMDLIRSSNINVSKQLPNFKNKILDSKFSELINIYKVYKDRIEKEYVDYSQEMEIFTDKLIDKVVDSKTTKIYFDGYSNFNKSEYSFIEKLLDKKIDIKITLCTDITDISDIYSNNSLDIFSTTNKTYLSILKIANKTNTKVENIYLDYEYENPSKDIKFLTDNLFKTAFCTYSGDSKNVHINLVTNAYSEINNIAHIISQKIKQGYRYNDFLIYTTDIELYDSIVKRCFYEYSIPVYSSISYSILNSKLAEYINYLFLISNDFSRENVLNTLKLGLNDISNDDICILENYLREFNIFRLDRNFIKNNKTNNDYIYDLERLNNIRENILNIFSDITKLGKEKLSFENLLDKIYSHLLNNKILENYDSVIYKIKTSDSNELIENVALQDQVWNNLIKVFISLKKVLKDSQISMQELGKLYIMLLNSIKLKTIPKALDQVELADINEYSSEMKKIVFFVGVNENKFPSISSNDLLFKDTELETLENDDIFIKETVIEKQKMAEFNIYKALSNILESLYIFIPSCDTESNTLRKSNLVTNIQNILNLKIVGNVTSYSKLNLNDLDKFSKEEVFENMMKEIYASDTVSDEVKKLYKYFKNEERYNKILEYKKKDDNLDKETINKIFGPNLVTSVSRLELFSKCPFSYFMKYSLNIKERKEFEISNIDIGSFLHEVLEEFSLYLYTNKIYWHTLLISKDYENVEEKLNQIIEEKVDKILSKGDESIRFSLLKLRLYNTVKRIVNVIANSFNQSSFLPEGYEITFSDNGVFAPIRIKLDNDKYMNIVGKIDRIDTYQESNNKYVRIIDYKSSERTLNIDDIKEGLSLQLVTYLNAYIKNNSKDTSINVIPAGMLYFNLSDKLVNIKDFTADEDTIKNEIMSKLRLKGIFIKDISILEKMDKNFDSKQSFIDITKRSINGPKVLDEENYRALLKESENILKNIGKQIIMGNVKINPNKKADYCKYCKYSSVCRKDICL